MSSLQRSYSSENITYNVKYRSPVKGYSLRRSTSTPDLANRYKPKWGHKVYRVNDNWTDYWWERRHYGGVRFWPNYGFPYQRYWHEKYRISTLANYPSLSWTSRFSQYDKLDTISWRRYRGSLMPAPKWSPYVDKRFEIRMSSFDARVKTRTGFGIGHIYPYIPRIWFTYGYSAAGVMNPSCWPYSYHYKR